MEAQAVPHKQAKAGSRIWRTLGVILFSIGAVLGMALSCIAIMGDAEATLSNADLAHLRDKTLRTLKCPVIITATEMGRVSATFENPTDKAVEFSIRTHISQYVPMWREIESSLPVAAGKAERLEWTVTADDAVQGNLILVKVLRNRKYPLPALLGSCGILVVDLPFLSGNQVTALVIAAGLLGLVGGMGLWVRGSGPLSGQKLDALRAMVVLAVAVLAGMVASLLGGWMLAILILAVTLLLIGAVVGHFATRSRRGRA